MPKLILKSPESGAKKRPHIIIVGKPEWQSLIDDFIDSYFGKLDSVIETPTFIEIERCLGQLEPNLVIITNFKLGLGLDLEKIIAKVPVSSIVVMCDKYTLPNVIPTEVHFTTSKDIKVLLPIVKKILVAQGY